MIFLKIAAPVRIRIIAIWHQPIPEDSFGGLVGSDCRRSLCFPEVELVDCDFQSLCGYPVSCQTF